MSLALIEMIAFFGVVLAFAIYQLVSVNRSMREDQTRDEDARKPEERV